MSKYLVEIKGHPSLTKTFDSLDTAQSYGHAKSVWWYQPFTITEIEGEVA